MTFHGINYLAVIVAAIAGMAVGAIWYTLLKDKWLNAANLNEADIKQDPKIYLMTFLCLLVVAYVMAGLIGHLYLPTLWNGIITALFCWVGFLLPPMIVNHRFQQSSWSLTFIDAGQWLVVFVLQGAIIGLFGL